MTIPTYEDEDGGVRRPGIDDVGGGAKEDDADFPPNPVTMPTAADANQAAFQIVALGAMTPIVSFSVTFSVDTPSIAYFASVRTDLVVGDFTVVDNGNGDTTIHWAAGTFPQRSREPGGLTINSDADNRGSRAYAYSSGATRGVRVKTLNGSATATDLDFSVDCYGE